MNTLHAQRETVPRFRLAILQRVCPGYRVALFSRLCDVSNIEVRLFIGADLPNSKVRSARDLQGINFTRVDTRFLTIVRRLFPWHIGLIRQLRDYQPDVILCEGESHLLGYIQAILYRLFYARRIALMHWCFISLPGETDDVRPIGAIVKAWFRRCFDAFLVYSSYSKRRLVRLGQPANKIFVATNVGEVERFLMLSGQLSVTKVQARERTGIVPGRFTVLYVGTLDAVKRPGLLLDLAGSLSAELYNFVLVGSGPLLSSLQERVTRENLSNVFLPGRVTDELIYYYRAADVLLIPGRGGIVMSEGMACGLPVIVHQADGTEYDLVHPCVTGLRLESGGILDFKSALELLQSQPALVSAMGAKAYALVQEKYNESRMAQSIVAAVTSVYVQNQFNKRGAGQSCSSKFKRTTAALPNKIL
jgi:glycosyltransferase involved in cell wall biosynthesis